MQTTHRALSVALALALFLPALAPATAQEKEVRDLAGFDSVSIGGGIDLVVRQGEHFLVEVESSGDLDDIVTEVRARKLEVRREQSSFGFFGSHADAVVHVTMPTLVSLAASGGSDVRTEGRFSGDVLRLSASGGSDVAIDVSVDRLEAEISGGSDVSLVGRARSASLQSSGGSDLNASRFTADEVDVHSSGGSDLSIAVRESIVGQASGGSDITYNGAPQSVDVDSTGGSHVRAH